MKRHHIIARFPISSIFGRSEGRIMRGGRWRAGMTALALAGAVLATAVQAADYTGVWSRGPDLSRGWEEIVGVRVADKIYIVSGYQAYVKGFSGASDLIEWRPLGLNILFDPKTGKYTNKAKIPVPAHHVAAAEVDGKIYVFGGFVAPEEVGGWSSVDHTWMYDPATDKWTIKMPMPTPRGGAHAAAVEGRIYVIGGFTSSTHIPGNIGMDQRVVERYDPKTDTWVQKQPMPTPRNHHTAAVINGRIYVAGGRIGAPVRTFSSHLNMLEEYDVQRNHWTRKALMPTPRSGSAYGVLNGKLVVIGGEDSKKVYNEVEVYDPVTNRWQQLSPMPVAKHAPANVVFDEKLYLFSGNLRAGGGSEVPTVDIFELQER